MSILWVILKSAVRQFSVPNNGVEYILQLSIENGWITDRESFIHGSLQNILSKTESRLSFKNVNVINFGLVSLYLKFFNFSPINF